MRPVMDGKAHSERCVCLACCRAKVGDGLDLEATFRVYETGGSTRVEAYILENGKQQFSASAAVADGADPFEVLAETIAAAHSQMMSDAA